MVPIDQARFESFGPRRNESIGDPQVAVEQSFRPAELFERLQAGRGLAGQHAEAFEQSPAQTCLFGGALQWRTKKSLQRADGIANIRGKKVASQITAIQARLSQQGV